MDSAYLCKEGEKKQRPRFFFYAKPRIQNIRFMMTDLGKTQKIKVDENGQQN